MKIKIKDKVYDSNKEPILIIFDNDEQRKTMGTQLLNMKEKGGIRRYCQYPTGYDENKIRRFMEI
jgi:hypothetical protein